MKLKPYIFSLILISSVHSFYGFNTKVPYVCAGAIGSLATLICLNKYIAWRSCYYPSKKAPLYFLKREPSITSATLYLHGWGETGKKNPLKWGLLDTIPGTVCSFDFTDAQIFGGIINLPSYPKQLSDVFEKLFPHIGGTFNKVATLLTGITQSNFAQLPDVVRALAALQVLSKEENIKTINLFGRSRGGAVLINLLSVLHNKEGKHTELLKAIGISSKEQTHILALIQNGTHIISVPMIDPSSVFPINHIAVGLVTHYNPWGLSIKKEVHQLEGLKLKTIIHYQKNDSIVGNQYDQWFYKAMSTINPQSTMLIYDEFDHNDWVPRLHEALTNLTPVSSFN